MIEGKATRKADQVLVEVESGQVGLPADEVARIEAGESPVQAFETKREALGPRDVEGRIALANYCRSRGMRGREEQLLREVLDLAPDHAEARERLGYVERDGALGRARAGSARAGARALRGALAHARTGRRDQ